MLKGDISFVFGGILWSEYEIIYRLFAILFKNFFNISGTFQTLRSQKSD